MDELYKQYCWTLDMIDEFKKRLGLVGTLEDEGGNYQMHKADLRGKIRGLKLSLSKMENNKKFSDWLEENTKYKPKYNPNGQ